MPKKTQTDNTIFFCSTKVIPNELLAENVACPGMGCTVFIKQFEETGQKKKWQI